MNQVTLCNRGDELRNRKKAIIWKRLLECWQLYVLILPAFVYIILFHYLPMYGIVIAIQDYNPAKGFFGTFVGFKHFSSFFNSPQFWNLIKNTVIINFYAIILCFPMPVLLALLLNEAKQLWLKKLVQNLTYFPFFISTVVIVGMLSAFLSPSIGIVNTMIKFLGINAIDFMGKAEWFRSVYIISGLWQNTGWSSIIFLAALSTIEQELHEAAKMDGAGRIKRIWHINIPGIMPTIIILFILNCGGILNVGFEKIFLMQNSLNLSVSEVISTYVYKIGIQGAKFSYSTAIGLFNSIINFMLLLAVNKVSKKLSDISLF